MSKKKYPYRVKFWNVDLDREDCKACENREAADKTLVRLINRGHKNVYLTMGGERLS